ncbi:MAG: hypothetical protein KDK78_09525, partial [Chlamydiia bacterium]|nr:hypothetical protein [Chlamydiia bacterium]
RKTLFKELDGCHLMHLAPCLDVAEVINACGDRSPLRIDEKVKLMERIDRSVLAALEDQFFALSEEHAKSIPIACLLAPIGKRGSMARGGAEFVRHFVDGGVLNCKGVGDCAKASVEVEAVCYALNELQWKDVLCSMRTSGIDDLRALRYLQPEYETRVHALMSADEYRSLRKRGGTSRKMEEDWRAQQVIACHHHMLERVDALEAKIDQLERLLKRTVGSSE